MAILLNIVRSLDIVNNAILPGPLLALPIGARLDISGFGPYEVNLSSLYRTRFRIFFMTLFLFLLISGRLSLLQSRIHLLHLMERPALTKQRQQITSTNILQLSATHLLQTYHKQATIQLN